MPACFVWVSQQFLASGALGFYVVAVPRVALGLLLVSLASASRAPRALRILGTVLFVLGLATALTGLVAAERGRSAVEWWLQQGFFVFRLTFILVLCLGSFIAFACAPRLRQP